MDAKHFFRKLRSTVRIVSTLFLARTFGKYRHSVSDECLDYAVYVWRGKEWAIPTAPLDHTDWHQPDRIDPTEYERAA